MEKAAVEIVRESMAESGWETRFRVRIDLGGRLTKREVAILYNSARKCEVHKMLSGPIAFAYEMASSPS